MKTAAEISIDVINEVHRAKRKYPKPKRIQLSRKRGWRMPANTVIVDRRSRRFGNPYRVGPDGTAGECVEKYRQLIARNIWSELNVGSIRECLAGKNLGCWCKIGAACHADLLLKIANQ